MKIGHCTNCQSEYKESVLLDGKVVEITGSKVLGHEQPGVLSTNYVEIYLLLSDFSVTRMSICANCRVGIDQSMLDNCFAALRKHMIMVSRASGAWEQAERWNSLSFVSWHGTNDQAMSAREKATEAK